MIKRWAVVAGVLMFSLSGFGAERSGFGLSVLTGDEPRLEYRARGTVYVEAVRGEPYALRITNPTPDRVGVALSVDGLNTIDAKHTGASSASKWLLGPYESTVISGWQVSNETARRFFFTGERHSYGAALGQTNDLGVIEAVFYREKHREISVYAPRSNQAPAAESQRKAAASDDYAATGMGEGTTHAVQRVDVDLEPRPVASIRIRYEFRPTLIKLGVFSEDPLERRERARGFDGYCPQPH